MRNNREDSAVTIECLSLSDLAYRSLRIIGCETIESVLRALPRWNDDGEMVCSNKILRYTQVEDYVDIIDELNRHNFLKKSEYEMLLSSEVIDNAK